MVPVLVGSGFHNNKPAMKLCESYPRNVCGLTLIEVTLVIAVLLGLISVLYLG